MDKSADAFRTISEVAEELDLPQHVLRFWETRFTQIKPLKRAGGRRFYRPSDIEILRAIRRLLYSEGYTIKGVQRILKEQGPRFVVASGSMVSENASQLASETLQIPTAEKFDSGWNEDLFGEASPPLNEAAVSHMQSADPELSGGDRPPGAKAAVRFGVSRKEAVERLKSILRELEACERMLDAARRP